MSRDRKNGDPHPTAVDSTVPWLEWTASGIGLLLVLGMFGVIAWQAFHGATMPPIIIVEAENTTRTDSGYRVLFRARNVNGGAAAQVEIEGTISAGHDASETSRVVLDYIPGHSSRKGGLFFTQDPRAGALKLRATGYAEP